MVTVSRARPILWTALYRSRARVSRTIACRPPPPPSLSLQKKAPVAPPSGKRKRDDAIESDAAPVSDGADNEDVVLDDEALRKLLDEADKVDVPVLDVLGVKQMLLSLEKKTNKNQELRMKFPGDPSK